MKHNIKTAHKPFRIQFVRAWMLYTYTNTKTKINIMYIYERLVALATKRIRTTLLALSIVLSKYGCFNVVIYTYTYYVSEVWIVYLDVASARISHLYTYNRLETPRERDRVIYPWARRQKSKYKAIFSSARWNEQYFCKFEGKRVAFEQLHREMYGKNKQQFYRIIVWNQYVRLTEKNK